MKIPTHYQGVPIPTPNPKRRNVTLSCAECRRLKLKCSRVFPCANCVKKGCEAIGSLTTGKGNRFVLANTEFLHEKINALSSRVRQLEDALEQSHANLSTEPHPLLTAELRALKKPIERGSENELLSTLRNNGLGGTNGTTEGDNAESNEVPDAVGSLSMNQSGRMNYHGSSANAMYLLNNEDHEEEEEEEGIEDSVLEYIPWLSYAFPFAPNISHVSQQLRNEIIGSMPDAREAEELAAFYFQYAAWMYTPIFEQDFKDQVFSLFYEGNSTAEQDTLEAHKFALLFFVFAMGKLTDPRTRDLSTQEAMKYFHIGRAALTLNQSLETPSVPLLQGLLLMCHFMFLANIESSRWLTMGIVVKLSQSLGLDRDGAKFGLSPEETRRHRSLMWEIYTYDSWMSLTFGRPSSFALSSIDCEMAHDTTHNEAGELEMSFSAWKHRFSSQCLSIVHEQAFGARTPNYKIIQELDKKVRGFYIPPSLQVPGFSGKPSSSSLISPTGEIEVPSLQLTMQRYTTWAIKEITIFYMHRGYFARSLEENKEDPLGGKYGPSVLAAHSTACSFINLIKSLHSQQPMMAERTWFFLTHVFSCSIVLGAIVTKCPSMALSRSALSNLESSYALFESVSHNPRVAKVLPVLGRLVKRAIASMNEYQSKKSLLPRLTSENVVTKEDEEALSSALGGTTRLVPRKQGSSSGSYCGTSETESLPPSSPRDAGSPALNRVGNSPPPQHIMNSPTTTLGHPLSPMESPRTEWQNTWGQVSQNVGYPYSMYPANPTNPQWSVAMDVSAANWYNAQPIQFPDPTPTLLQHQHPRHQQPQYLSVDVTMGNTFPSFGQTSSALSGAMSPYDYPPQQAPPPQNNAHAHWQNLFVEMGANYS
ncbi:hypothetical protein BDM02DRAFT_3145961 [Thelephora ganbajun]|uniref:Uncharacterized protein n=1 Tax=Thelephora ganbajun TaxID=370292 RepID=A0ACB6ZDC7_THEGA|nr:hypothetical protein BDM02DRAFT_3145961 [Thelephora ganbajun]